MDICNFAYKLINLDGFSGNARDWQSRRQLFGTELGEKYLRQKIKAVKCLGSNY